MAPLSAHLNGAGPSASGVWGVRNYYTTLERRATAGAAITPGYVAMAVAAAVMATAGLLLDSAAAVIGSMCVAPFMAPSRAVCIGLLFRNWKVFAAGLAKQVLGLLGVGAGVAILITLLLQETVGDLSITHEISLRAMPSARAVALSAIIAVSAGAVASLALITHPSTTLDTPWGQVLDAVIGVEIAISLLPPAAVMGIAYVLESPANSVNAFMLLIVNLVGIDVIGSLSILAIRGVRRRYLEAEKSIRDVTSATIAGVSGFISVGSTIDVTLLNKNEARVDVLLRREFGGEVPEHLAQTIASSVLRATSMRIDVAVEVVPILTHAGIPR
jgi:uncharacterized hydrophobic protein (TIGR00271 family)